MRNCLRVTPKGEKTKTIGSDIPKSHKYLPYHGQKYFAKIAYGELFVISVTTKYMHGELLGEISKV